MSRRFIADAFAMAWQRISARRGRTVAMGLGPMVAVATLVGATGLANNANGEIIAAFDRLGQNFILASVEFNGDASSLMPDDALDRVADLADVTGVAGLGIVPSRVARSTRDGDVMAERVVTARGLAAALGDDPLRAGRLFDTASPDEVALPRILIGSLVADRLPAVEIGRTELLIDGRAFVIVGILRRSPATTQLDGAAIMDQGIADELFSAPAGWTDIVIRTQSQDVLRVRDRVPPVITLGAPPAPSVRTAASLLAAQAAVDATLATTIIALAALALLIGAVGIGNAMSMAVLQRRREIGVLHAIGHPPAATVLQFVAEATIASVAGSLAGAVLGHGLVEVSARTAGFAGQHTPALTLAGIIASVLAGMLAATLPARTAARVEPALTLRED